LEIKVEKTNNQKVIVKIIPNENNQKEIDFVREFKYQNNIQTVVGGCEISVMLRALFDKHKYFYKAWGLNDEQSADFHPEDADFYEGCDGFKRFMQQEFGIRYWWQISEQNLAKIANIITTTIKNRMQEFITQSRAIEITQHLVFPSLEKQQEEQINIDMLSKNNIMLITNNGMYAINLTKLNSKTLDELKMELQESMQNIYNLQIEALKATIQQKEDEVKKEIQKAKMEGIQIGLSLSKDWQIEDEYLVYRNIIYATKVKNNEQVYNLNNKNKKKFYISGLKVPLEQIVSYAECEEAYHPNAKSGGRVCLGDLEGKPLLEVLQKLPQSLEVANLDSAFENSASEELSTDFDDLIEGEEGEIWEGDE
jgi:hypothetical protein